MELKQNNPFTKKGQRVTLTLLFRYIIHKTSIDVQNKKFHYDYFNM
ncbi:hypothetical protein bthur0010_59580 [Bacillus thuringiensis serovar pondicheriensis BGSC 4BA1]|nr:hypothetical protein bthur0010_59580 [Bacillus thuringiensis serovar pondicheriensis BGSC 4BA1]